MPDRIQLLLVEDNPADADLTREQLAGSKILHDLHVVGDGVEALALLRHQGAWAAVPAIDLVLLDLNLPRKDGLKVLAEMKQDPALRSLPVVVLTSSQAEEDIARSYALQASAYVTKPVDLLGFGKIVRGIENFWFSVVRFPAKD